MADGEALGIGALFSFEGRIRRGTFWAIYGSMILLVGIVAAVLIPMMAKSSGGEPAGDPSTTTLVAIVAAYAVVLWLSLATQAKRWHDMDKSAWMVLLNFIPLVNLFAFLYLGFNAGTEGANRFGPGPIRIF